MTIHLGNVSASSTLYIPFATYDSNGASVTLTGLAVTDIEIYKNGSTTQRASDAGYTLLDTDGIDFDGLTGIHGFSIDLSDNTDAGFYAVGSFYWVVVASVTVDSQTVNFIAATFRIVSAEDVTGQPKVDTSAWNGTAVATPTTAGVPEVDVTHWLGTAAATPTVAGVPEVDVTHFNGTAGTFASGRPEVNTSHIAGSAVSTSSAQIGVNVVQVSGDATAADNLESEYDGTGYGHVLQRTTIATLASQTSFTLTAGSADNDAYNGCIIVIQDASTAAQKAVGVISDYTGATKTVTLLNDPAVFTMATTDIVTIIADRAVKPTVDNRTLDVSAGGEAGVDWANVGSPTTTVGLSGTTVKTATDVETDTADIQSRLPAALVSGRIDASVGAMAANTFTASALAADAVTEIQSGLSTVTTAQVNAEVDTALADIHLDHLIAVADPGAVVANNSFLAKLTSKSATAAFSDYDNTTDSLQAIRDKLTDIETDTQAIETDTQDIQSRLPAALVGGRIDANVGAISADATAADNLEALLDGTGGVTIAGNLSGSVGSVMGAVGSVTGNVGGNVVGSVGSVTGLTNGTIADAVWDEATTGHTTAGTFGEQVKTDIDAILDDTGTSGVVIGTLGTDAITAASLSDAAVLKIWTTQLTEAYAADGVAFTGAQGLYQLWSFAAEKNKVGNVITTKKLDGTTAMQFTLDSAESPATITRSS